MRPASAQRRRVSSLTPSRLGTKNKDLHYARDGSLTLTASTAPPGDEDLHRNWLPAPAGPFCLFMRAYWPGQQILDGTWTPPPVTRHG